MRAVKKTGIKKNKSKKIFISKWEDIENGEQLKTQLIEASKEYKEAGEHLKQIVGEDSIIHNTFIGMRNIEKLESDLVNKDDMATKKTVEFCKKLKALTKLTGNLIHTHNIDFLLIQRTKSMVFNTQK
ncbi:hypothetical protein ACTFIU_004141 [Dictyostelium citrinum]